MVNSPLDHISIKGFKSLRDVDRLPLGQVNIVIGANGSGKSNFIGVFSFLQAIRSGKLQEYVRRSGGADQVLFFGSRNTKQVEIHISFGGGVNQYRLQLSPNEQDTLFPSMEAVYYEGPGCKSAWNQALPAQAKGLEAGISGDVERIRVASWVQHRLGLWRVYHVHDSSADSPMRKTAQLADNAYLRTDGSNLPAFLFLLQQKHSDSYRKIRATVRQVAPFFDDFVLRPDPLNEATIRLEWKHTDSDVYFGPAALSDGSLRFMVLATLLLQPERLRPSVILVDEPELGLHPFAIGMLASMIKETSVQTQIIVSTQSPLVLDHFEPEDVIVAERVQGGTELRRLTSAPLLQWLEEYSLGQLWEKNELGGRPGR